MDCNGLRARRVKCRIAAQKRVENFGEMHLARATVRCEPQRVHGDGAARPLWGISVRRLEEKLAGEMRAGASVRPPYPSRWAVLNHRALLFIVPWQGMFESMALELQQLLYK